MKTSEDQHHSGEVLRLPVRDLNCAYCAEELEKALKANAHIADAKVDFLADIVEVRYHVGMIDEAGIRELINESGRCSCGPEEGANGTAHIHHQAQMAPITMGTKQDRMQYELSSSGASAHHEHAHQEAAGHAGMDHDIRIQRFDRENRTHLTQSSPGWRSY